MHRYTKFIIIKNSPATVYLVHRLRTFKKSTINTRFRNFHSGSYRIGLSNESTYSEINAALPSTVKRTARYNVVPQNQCPVSYPASVFKSPQNKMTENPKRTCSMRCQPPAPLQTTYNGKEDAPSYGIVRFRSIAKMPSSWKIRSSVQGYTTVDIDLKFLPTRIDQRFRSRAVEGP